MADSSRTIVTTAFFLVAAFGAFGFSAWQADRAASLLRAERASVAEIDARVKRVEALSTRWETVEAKANAIERTFLQREDARGDETRRGLPQFLALVEATAASAGVTVQTSVQEEEDEIIYFRLTAKGSFADLFVFVTHLNVLPTLLFVEDVGFRAATTEAGRGAPQEPATADIVLRVPLRVEGGVKKEEAGAAEEAASDEEDALLDGAQ